MKYFLFGDNGFFYQECDTKAQAHTIASAITHGVGDDRGIPKEVYIVEGTLVDVFKPTE